MSGALIAIYVVAAWAAPSTTRWHEFQLEKHFFSAAVCERYRSKLIAAWVDDPAVPFHASNVLSSRCGVWTPDADKGDDL